MTKDEVDRIIDECHLSDEKKLFLKSCEINIDERFKYLVDQVIQTISRRDNSIHWEPIVFTGPMQGLNAGSLSINEECKLLIFDSNAMNLFGNIAKLIEKLVPNDGLEIVPPLENIKESTAKINSLIDINNYNEFKKAILIFNGLLAGSVYDNTKQTGITRQIRDACMLFLIGHECVHLWKNHRRIDDNEKDAVYNSWQQELEADSLGYELMVDTMKCICHPKIKYEAQFDLGFEIFFQCLALTEPLSLISGNDEYSNTHPDAASSRLGELREIAAMSVPLIDMEELKKREKQEDQWRSYIYERIMTKFIRNASDEIFDTYTAKLTGEILFQSSKVDKKQTDNKLFMDELSKNICSIESTFYESNISGLQEWESENYTSAVVKFAKADYTDHQKRIIAVFYDYILERYYSRTNSCVGQLPEFREGIKHLKNLGVDEAEIYFQKALVKEPDNKIIRFALGLTYSLHGQICFNQKDYENAKMFFKKDLKISPIVRRESLVFLALIDDKVFNIISRVPSWDKRLEEFVKFPYRYANSG